MRAAALLLLATMPATAEPRFEAVANALPETHVYSGGWEHFVGGGVAVFDCNGDGRPDIFVAGGEAPARLFMNASSPGTIAFEAGGTEVLTGVTGAYPIDIDSDGILDLAILRVGANALWRGTGDCRFEDATDEWGFTAGERWSTAFSAIWENGAGWPTIAIGNYVDRTDPTGPFEACDGNELHRPGPRGFAAPVPLEPGFCALSMLISDWQRIGTPELRISNDRHYYVRGGYEEMWRLDPLSPRTEKDGWPRISLWGMGIASADITRDGLPEVMLTSMGDQLLKLNTGEGYTNAPFELGTYAQRPHVGDDGRPATGWHAEFGDIDNDGRLDLFIAKGNVDQMPSNAMEDPNNLLMQEEDGTFRERSVEAGLASTHRGRGAALVDLDGDGKLDVILVNRRAPLEVWQNVSDTGNWLKVDLQQSGSNTRAVGAWVEVEAGGAVQAREITVGGGHAGGQSGPLHFGLGDAETARVRVIWPDGSVSKWRDVPVNVEIGIDRID